MPYIYYIQQFILFAVVFLLLNVRASVLMDVVILIFLSACCESKRTVGTRLGQGMFTLVSVEGAQPCIRFLSTYFIYLSVYLS